MTVIAWDGRMLASDSWVTEADGRIVGVAKKIEKTRYWESDVLVGAAGITAHCELFLKVPNSPPDSFLIASNDEELTSQGLIIEKTAEGPKLTLVCGGFVDIEPHHGVFAIGMGADVAIGAMMAGATAAEAVKICAKVYGTIGGEIQVLEL